MTTDPDRTTRRTQGRTTEQLLMLLGGIGAGAAMMFLFDPEKGSARRRRAGQAALTAYQATGDALSTAWETAREQAGQLSQAAAATAGDISNRVAESRIASRISEGAGQVRDEAADRLAYLVRGRPRYMGLQSCTSQSMAAVGCIALGLGMMYLLDPVSGRRRRAMAGQKFTSAFGRMAHGVEATGKHLWNRTSGMVSEVGSHLSREELDDRVLVERIRSEMGHNISNPGSINVQANGGRVTLSGNISQGECDRLLKSVWSTRGVRELINRLEVGDTAGIGQQQTSGETSFTSRL